MARSQRESKTKALQLLNAVDDLEEADNDIPSEIEDDDFAEAQETLASSGENMENAAIANRADEIIDELPQDWPFLNDVSDEDEQEDASLDEDDSQDRVEENATCVSKDGNVWSIDCESAGRRPLHNILTDEPRFKRGLRPATITEAFFIIFYEIVNIALMYSNLAARRLAIEHGIEIKQISKDEMVAFVALHALAGAFKAHHRPLKELWNVTDGVPLFRATMSLKRFEQIKIAFRFDDPLRRDRSDKIAPVRQIIDVYNRIINEIYTPNANLTIDEMLIEFHGRISFKQYIPTKPGKFGIKAFWMTESETAIPLRCLLYCGRQTFTPDQLEEHGGFVKTLIMNLAKPYLNCGRNITGDNYFSDISTSRTLLEKRTTYVGTIKSNKRCIPSIAKNCVNRTKGSSKHFYSRNDTLCSFLDKGKKPVLLISSMHGYQRNEDDRKPEIVLFYNSTKSGVDTLDKIVRNFSSKRKYRRWPPHIFFTLMDCAIYVSYKMMEAQSDYSKSHYQFKKDLAYELCLPLVKKRSQLPALRQSVKRAMELIGLELAPISNSSENATQGPRQGRCKDCPRQNDRKSKTKCQQCHNFICPSHQVHTCLSCFCAKL